MQFLQCSPRPHAILGAEQIIVHGLKVPGGPYSQECYEANCAYYQSFAPYCRKFGIRIAVENLITTIFPRPELLNRVMAALDPGCFVTCMDLGHALVAGMATQDYLAGLTPGILKALHIHDNDGSSDQHRLPHLGNVNWEAVMEGLAAYGYSGDFTMELTGYLGCFPPRLLPQALTLAAAVGRDLMQNSLTPAGHRNNKECSGFLPKGECRSLFFPLFATNITRK